VSPSFSVVCVQRTGRMDKATCTSVSSAACKAEGKKIHGITLKVVCGVS